MPNTIDRILFLAVLALPAPLLAAPAVQAGDAVNGAVLYGLHCASCHGATGAGDGYLSASLKAPRPTNLGHPGFLVSRSDRNLFDVVMKGGAASGAHFTMPAFGTALGVLDGWDLVAFVRQGQLDVSDFFPDAARFAAKDYLLEDEALKRLEDVATSLSAPEQKVTVVTVFSGARLPDGPEFVPQDPRLIATLRPKQKVGYVAFVEVAVPGVNAPVPVGIGMGRNGVIQKLLPKLDSLSAKERTRVAKLFEGYEGQGGKRGAERASYTALKPSKTAGKDGAAMARALTRSYYRGVEGAVAYDKEERELHWAD